MRLKVINIITKGIGLMYSLHDGNHSFVKNSEYLIEYLKDEKNKENQSFVNKIKQKTNLILNFLWSEIDLINNF
jgi:hypothetical protein